MSRGDRSTFWTLGGAMALPLVVFVLLQIAFGLQLQRRQVEDAAMAQAREITALVDGQLRADYAALSVLATSQSLAAHDYRAAFERLKEVDAREPRWVKLILTDVSGRQIFETDRPFGPSESARPEVAAFLTGKVRPGPSATIEQGPAPCPCLVIHAPVVEAGRMTHVVTLEIDPRGFQEVLMAHDGGDEGVSAIVDRNGRFVARSLDIGSKIAAPATHYVRDAMRTGSTGLYRGRTYEGFDNYTAFQTAAESGISTHVAIKAGRVLGPARGYVALLLVGAAISLALTGGIAAFGVHRIRERRREEERRRQSQKLEVMGQLAGGVAHDFNNLLLVILGGLHKLKAMSPDKALDRPISLALAAAERGKILTGQLLTFARVEPIRDETVDLSALVGDIQGLIAQSVGPAVALTFDIAPDAARVKTSRSELEFALINLAVNARDAMPDGGRLTIAARRSKARRDFVDLGVSDTGTGMPKAVADRAMEPFFTTKAAGKGTGLGLAQAYGLATRSGGSLAIDSREGEGTTITLTLPAS